MARFETPGSAAAVMGDSSGISVATLGIPELRSAPAAPGIHGVGYSGASSGSCAATGARRDFADLCRRGRLAAPVERRGAASLAIRSCGPIQGHCTLLPILLANGVGHHGPCRQ